jgi:hypothetical protein
MMGRTVKQACYICVVLITTRAVSIASSAAAEITVDDMYDVIHLEGTIVSGDYEKLKSIALHLDGRSNPFPITLNLFSPGGEVTEAIKMGRLVRSLRWQTRAPNGETGQDTKKLQMQSLKNPEVNYMCASSCFLIFVAGIERSVGGYRSYTGSPVLGIHRPYLSETELKAISSKDAITTSSKVRTVVENYLREMSVPSKYANMMFSIPKDQIQWLTPSDVHSDLAGFIPELKDWVDARCDSRTDIEKHLSQTLEANVKREKMLSPEDKILWDKLADKDNERRQCEDKVRIDLNKQGFQEVFPVK